MCFSAHFVCLCGNRLLRNVGCDRYCDACHLKSRGTTYSCGSVTDKHPHGYDLCSKCESKYSKAPYDSLANNLQKLGYGLRQTHETILRSNGDLKKALEILIDEKTELITSNIIDHDTSNININNIDSYLIDLIEGYIKSIYSSQFNYKIIPIDINYLIVKFYGIDPIHIGFIIFFKKPSHFKYIKTPRKNMKYPAIIQLQQLPSNKYILSNLYNISKDHEFESNGVKGTLMRQCRLPKYFKDILSKNINNINMNILSSNKWNLIFNWSGYSYVTLINTQYPQNVYNVPSPQIICSWHTRDLVFVDSKSNQKIYRIQWGEIHEWDLNNDNELYWKLIANNSFTTNPTNITCACMVDNDRFIFGTKCCREAELYALNCKKRISLSSRIHRWDSSGHGLHSLYHSIFHKIIAVGSHSVESYDINKNIWISVFHDASKTNTAWLQNIWYSSVNPNIIYGVSNGYLSEIVSLIGIDIRSNDNKLVFEKSISKPQFSDGFYLSSL